MGRFQVVVLAGGKCKELFPLVSKELPKALLPVGNRPVLSYVLDLLEYSNLRDVIVVAAGEEASVLIGAWIAAAYRDRLLVEMLTVDEDADTADALRAVSDQLVGDDILVISGDLVCDVPLGAVASAHTRQQASLTALLCPLSAGDDPSVKAKPSDFIGLTSDQHLVYISAASHLGKELRIHRSVLREANQMEIRSNLVDAHLYAFNRVLLQEVLENTKNLQSLKQELVPYIVRSQLNRTSLLPKTKFACTAYIAEKGRYCARVNSIQLYSDVNRDVAGDIIHLTGFSVSAQNNVIDMTVNVGSKTVVGPQCIIGEGSLLGEKCSIKKSVVGRHCRIGSNVKIINSVVMNHVTVEDGCLIQNCVVCSNAQLQERATLKDCQVGAGYIVAPGADHKAEALAKKDKLIV